MKCFSEDIVFKIEESIKKYYTNMGLKTYVEIMDAVQEENHLSEKLQDSYITFYRIRKDKKSWIPNYFVVLNEYLKKNEKPSIKEIVDKISIDGRIEMSYASKLLATINPDKPIYDKWVRYALLLGDYDAKYAKELYWKLNIYRQIEDFYENDIYSLKRRILIDKFDEVIDSEYKTYISGTKKIDYVLWCMGKDGISAK